MMSTKNVYDNGPSGYTVSVLVGSDGSTACERIEKYLLSRGCKIVRLTREEQPPSSQNDRCAGVWTLKGFICKGCDYYLEDWVDYSSKGILQCRYCKPKIDGLCNLCFNFKKNEEFLRPLRIRRLE